MDGQTSERALSADDVAIVLAAHGFGSDRPATGAVILALNHPLRIVWANRDATQLLGSSEAAELFAHLVDGQGRDGIAKLVQRLVPGEGARSERLRLFRGFRARTVTVSASRTRLADGEEVVVLAVPTPNGTDDSRQDFAVDALQRSAPEPTAMAEQVAPALPVHETAPALPTPASAGQRRFLWRTDAAHRVVGVADAVPVLKGLDDGTMIGRSLSSAADAMAADPKGALMAALDAGRAFNGVIVVWPLADGSGTVPITLGAVPVRGAGGDFGGFRGFGLIDLRDILLDHPAAPLAAPPLEAGAPASPPLAIAPPSAGDLDRTTPASADVAAGPKSGTGVRASFSSAKVVALRPSKMTTGKPEAVVPGGDVSALPSRRRDDESASAPAAYLASPSEEATNLSSVEQFNFGEIARALKGAPGDAGGAAAVGSTASTENSAAILSALPTSLIVDCRGRIVYANAAFLALTGYPSARALEDAGGRAHLLGGLDAAQVAGVEEDRAFPIVDSGGGIVSVEGRVAVIDWGGRAAELLTMRPVNDRLVEVQSLQFDVRRREAEAQDHRALLDQVSDAVVIVDGQGRLLMVNGTGERMFGRDRNSIVGESIGALLTPECQSAALGAVFAASSAGPGADEARIAVTARRRAGGHMPLSMSLRSLGPGKIGIVLRDESAFEALRNDVDHLRAEVDETGHSRSDFLAKVSHEIRTPLSAILGFAEIMLDERFGPVGNPRYRDYLADIHAAGQHVIDLVTDLLDLSTMQGGQKALTVVSTDVNRVVSESVGDAQGSAHRDRVIVRLSLMPQLPYALVDEPALRQVMDNILSNAIRFNEPGGQVIVSTAVVDTGGIAVRVRDNGIGMSDAELAIAMEPFRQISTGKPGGGSGLGLPLSRALVEANRASMSIKSRKNEGTLVEIVLRPASEQPLRVPAA